MDLSPYKTTERIPYLISCMKAIHSKYNITHVVIEQQNNRNVIAQKIATAIQVTFLMLDAQVTFMKPPSKSFVSTPSWAKRKKLSLLFANEVVKGTGIEFTVHDHSDSFLLAVFYLIEKVLNVSCKDFTVDECRKLIVFQFKSKTTENLVK